MLEPLFDVQMSFRAAGARDCAPWLSPSYFPPRPLRPPCRRFRLAPSQRSSPQAISQGFPSVHPVVAHANSHGIPSVHPVVASVSLLPNGALPKLFPTVSPLSILSSLPSRFRLPQANSHGFPSVQPVVTSVSLPSRQSQLNENRSIGDAFGK